MMIELEALEKLLEGYSKGMVGRNYYDIVYQALLKAQEQEKVLKVIFEKSVDIFRLKKIDFNTFNQLQRSCKLPELTEEEFDLLKRWTNGNSSSNSSNL